MSDETFSKHSFTDTYLLDISMISFQPVETTIVFGEPSALAFSEMPQRKTLKRVTKRLLKELLFIFTRHRPFSIEILNG